MPDTSVVHGTLVGPREPLHGVSIHPARDIAATAEAERADDRTRVSLALRVALRQGRVFSLPFRRKIDRRSDSHTRSTIPFIPESAGDCAIAAIRRIAVCRRRRSRESDGQSRRKILCIFHQFLLEPQDPLLGYVFYNIFYLTVNIKGHDLYNTFHLYNLLTCV